MLNCWHRIFFNVEVVSIWIGLELKDHSTESESRFCDMINNRIRDSWDIFSCIDR